MPLFPVVSGAVLLNSGSAATDTYQNGVLVSASGNLVRATTTGGDERSNGILRTATGQIVYVNATAGLPAGTRYVNGVPTDANGAICISTDAMFSMSNGLPMAANGAMCAGIIP